MSRSHTGLSPGSIGAFSRFNGGGAFSRSARPQAALLRDRMSDALFSARPSFPLTTHRGRRPINGVAQYDLLRHTLGLVSAGKVVWLRGCRRSLPPRGLINAQGAAWWRGLSGGTRCQ